MVWLYEFPKKVLLVIATIFLIMFQRLIWRKLKKAETLSQTSPDISDSKRQLGRAIVMLALVFGLWDLKELFLRQEDLSLESFAWWIFMFVEVVIDSMRGYYIVNLFCLRWFLSFLSIKIIFNFKQFRNAKRNKKTDQKKAL